ncbi:helix-turn-helix domain-containing protein [Streptomyces sp. NPDC093060]|uniref:helix-turn-helix domain-containing protein n=1 Tax=Streptomyces sp. NPDC093060 TaxID=3366019 RepID=UPI00380C45D1
MPASGSSSVQAARRILADRLREICKDSGLDGKRLATACGWHPSKVSRISTAKTQPSADDIRAWCRACGVEEQTDDLIASLRAVEGIHQPSWRLSRHAPTVDPADLAAADFDEHGGTPAAVTGSVCPGGLRPLPRWSPLRHRRPPRTRPCTRSAGRRRA